MRILKLEVQNVRGVPHLSLAPSGKTFLVYGPNGSGKSAIVDAVDFLLTGRISRLAGKGTGELSLSRHGPHIDHDEGSAIVTADVEFLHPGTVVTLSRRMSEPNILTCEPECPEAMEAIAANAACGIHALTRREILRFITAEPKSRAEQIQALLDISEVEEIRKSLVAARNELDRASKSAKSSRQKATAAVNSIIGAATDRPDLLLAAINQSRSTLGGGPIEVPSSSQLKQGLRIPAAADGGAGQTNIDLLRSDIDKLSATESLPTQRALAATDGELRDLLGKIRSTPEHPRTMEVLQLTKSGIALLDETGACPLCDTPWPQGKLREHLEAKAAAARTAKKTQDRIDQLAMAMTHAAGSVSGLIKSVLVSARSAAPNAAAEWLESWLRRIQCLTEALADPMATYPLHELGPEEVQRMLAPPRLLCPLHEILAAAEAKSPKPSAEQTAWDLLTRLEENLLNVERAEAELSCAAKSHSRAVLLADSFERARDEVLEALYTRVRDRFVALYKELHGGDEPRFSATVQPDGAGLDLEVDFYGRGMHPPHALHSEGHQDSMGLCLYLVLNEAIASKNIDLIVLDDVMMSIDKGHRRQLSRLLTTSFAERQFLITTHDTAWAHQLQHDGVVDRCNMVHLHDWSVESGPRIGYTADVWQGIEEALRADDVPTAAQRLRRTMEEYFDLVCASLDAKTPHRLDQRLELGDLMPAAFGRYCELLKQAKAASQSWGNNESFLNLQATHDIAQQVWLRTQAESWSINPSVHYSRWADLGRNDFTPVYDALRDLSALFRCNKCGAMLSVVSGDSRRHVAVRCSCGTVNWNLVTKSAP